MASSFKAEQQQPRAMDGSKITAAAADQQPASSWLNEPSPLSTIVADSPPSPPNEKDLAASPNASSTPSPLFPPVGVAAGPAGPAGPSKWQQSAQIIGSFVLYMNAWAMPNSFGVFQSFYADELITNKTESQIAWIGSLQAFLLLFVGVLVGPLIDAGHMRLVLVAGWFFVAFGLMMTSLSTQYYQLMLAQGVVVGVGAGCIFLPSVAVLPQWFTPKRAPLALGIVATGASVGGIIYPAVFHSLQPSAGFGWAVRTIAFITLASNAVGVVVLKYHNPLPAEKRRLFDISMWKEPYFPIMCASNFLAFVALYVPMFFIQSYYSSLHTTDQSSSSSNALVFWLLPILMAGSLPGRIIPNMLAASFTGNLNMITIMIFLCGVLNFCWIAVGSGSTAGVIVFAILYGFTSGGTVSLIPPVVVSTARDKRNIGTRMGMLMTCGGLGALIGNPVAGAILAQSHSGSYLSLQLFAGVLPMVSAAGLLVAKGLKADPQGGASRISAAVKFIPTGRV